MGQHLNAIDAYDFAIAIDENFASGYFNKAHALANLGNYYEAISLYRETFKYEDPEAYTYHYIGECFEKAGKLEEAVEQYQEAVYKRQKLELKKTLNIGSFIPVDQFINICCWYFCNPNSP